MKAFNISTRGKYKMKIYTQTYDLTKASPQRFWVTPFSDFKIGIKLLSKGELVDKNFTVKAGAVELTPDEDKIDGFTIFTIKSGNTGFVDYTIEVAGIAEKLKLTQIVTNSTVFDIGGSGGNVPSDVATKSWVENYVTAETSTFIDETALAPYATTSAVESAISTATTDMATKTWVGQQDYATTSAMTSALAPYAKTSDIASTYATTSAMTSAISAATSDKVTGSAIGSAPVVTNAVAVYASVWASMSASANANTLYVVLSDPS